MVKLLKLYFVPLLDLGKKQKWIEMDPRWQVVHTQAADRKYERAGSSREKERSAFCKLGEMGRGGFCQAGWWSFGGRLFGIWGKNFVYEGYH